MIRPTTYLVDKKIIEKIANIEATGKLTINEPTGDFFYDPWITKREFADTPIDDALSKLPFLIGEARIINLQSGNCYYAHSDIDDRYHLNLTGDCAALINIETQCSYFLEPDGIWYSMNAGPLHSAVNYGQYERKQLVVRKLLFRNKLSVPLLVTIKPTGVNPRFVFDNTISGWLNSANKRGIISSFSIIENGVQFNLEKEFQEELKKIIPTHFEYTLLEQ